MIHFDDILFALKVIGIFFAGFVYILTTFSFLGNPRRHDLNRIGFVMFFVGIVWFIAKMHSGS